MPLSKFASRRPLLLGAAGLLAIGMAAAARLAHRPPATEDLLRHANAREAGDVLRAQLAQSPAEQRLPRLLKALDAPNPGLRLAALDALTSERNPESARAVEQAFTDSASSVREMALRALPQMDSARGWWLLCAALRDSDTQIRQQAAVQIEQAAKRAPSRVEKRILPALIAALDDTDPVVAANITHALTLLTGQGRRVSAKAASVERVQAAIKWQSWWRKNAPKWRSTSGFAQIAPRTPLRADPVPPLEVTDVDGHIARLTDWRGQIVLLNFWGTWCPPCRQELPDLEQVQKENRASSVRVLGLAVNEQREPDDLKRWCETQGLTYRQALCPPAVQDEWGDLEGVPVSVLIDRRGRERYRWKGPRDAATFQAAIDRLILE